MLVAKNNNDDFFDLNVLKEDFITCEKILKSKNIIELSCLIRRLNDFNKTLTTDFKYKISKSIIDNFNFIVDFKLEKFFLIFIIKNVELSKSFIEKYHNLFLEAFKGIIQEQIQNYNEKYILNFNVAIINTISDKLKTLEDVLSFLIVSNKKNFITKNIEILNNFLDLKLMNNDLIKNNFKEILFFIPFDNLHLLSLFFEDNFTIKNKNGEFLNYKKYFIIESISNLLWLSINSEFNDAKKVNLHKLENILTSLDEKHKLDIENLLSSKDFINKNKEVVEKCLLILNFTTINKTKKIAI